MRSGWLKFHRALVDSELWLSEPFTRGQAWIDLLAMAAFKPTSVRIGGRKISLKPGQLCWSVVQLARRWQWSRGKTIRFFDELKSEHQIEQVSVGVSTVTTIVNWRSYQVRGTHGGTANDTHDGTHDGTQSKNVKECKEEEEAAPASTSDKMTLAEMRFHCHVGDGEDDAFDLICERFDRGFILEAIGRRRRVRERNGWKPKPCLSDLSEWIKSNYKNYTQSTGGA